MRALLATNFRADEVRDKIAPALSKHVELVGVIEAERNTDFRGMLDGRRPDVVLLMNEVMSHSASEKLADACRTRNIKLAVIGQQKSTWPAVFARILPPTSADSFGMHLRRAREAARLTHVELSNRCGVSKEQVRKWEADDGIPTRQEFKRLRGSMRALAHHPPVWRDGWQAGDVLVLSPEEQAEPPTIANEVEPPKTFGEAVAAARIREGLTQEELGEVVGAHQTIISRWEANEVVPVLDNYRRLLDLLPELALAPEPPCRDIDKPVGNEEPVMTSRMPNPVLPQNFAPPPSTRGQLSPLDAENEKLVRQVQQLSGEVAELKRRLDTAERDSVTGAANALKTLVRGGFMTEAEAAERWTARIR